VIQAAMTAAVAALSTAVDVTLIHAVVRPAGSTAVDDQQAALHLHMQCGALRLGKRGINSRYQVLPCLQQ
jgi:hypothetical protein